MSEVKFNFIKDIIRFLCCSPAGLLLIIVIQQTTPDRFLKSQRESPVNQITTVQKTGSKI